MNFATKEHVNSKKCKGVVFTLNATTQARRWDLRMALADASAKIRGLIAESQGMRAEFQDPGQRVTPARMVEIDRRMQEIEEESYAITTREINPAWLRAGLVAIEGLQIDGKPATAEDLINGPVELYAEVLETIQSRAGLDVEALKNLLSRSTSAEPAGGTIPPTTAPAAELINTTEAETAAAILPTQ